MPRRQAARHGSFGLPCFAAALVAAAFASPASAQIATAPVEAGGYSITLDAGANLQGSGLRISGTWANTCLPTVEHASLNGSDLTITARPVLKLCEATPTPMTLSINPASALGLASLPPGIYRVRFNAADGAHAAANLRAFAVIDTSAEARSAIAPESGFWWPVTGAASGVSRNVMSLEFQGTQLSAALLGYGDDGRSKWQFGTAAFNGRIAHVSMLQLAGTEASSGEPPGRRGEAGLVADLEFHSNSHATAWLSRTLADGGLDVQQVDVVRLPFADVSDGAAWQGEWILVAQDDSVPQRLRLRVSAAAADNRFVLGDPVSGMTLDCLYDPENSDLPAQSCTMVQRDGKVFAKLDEVAMSRMDGKREDGVAVHLLRVTQ